MINSIWDMCGVNFDSRMFLLFQMEVVEGCRMPVKMSGCDEWRKFLRRKQRAPIFLSALSDIYFKQHHFFF